MTLSFYVKLYLLTIPVFFAVDLLWLGWLAKGFYRRNLGDLLSPDVNWAAAVVFYLIYIAGILFFAVRPALAADLWGRAALLGALFGAVTYATYDLTNLATLKNWPLAVAVVDILWGAVLCTLVALYSFWIAKWLAA